MQTTRLYLVIFSFLLVPMMNTSATTFNLRFFNQRVYYPGTPVWLQASITNNSAEDFIFSLADEPLMNMSVRVGTLTNQTVTAVDEVAVRSLRVEPSLYRLIKLRPGEQMSFLVELSNFVDIRQAGNYIIEAEFDPDFFNKSVPMVADKLRLVVRPSVTGQEFQDMVDLESGELLVRQALSPDQVVSFVLMARQRSQWNRVFLYMNVESFYQRNTNRRRRFLNASDEMRIRLIEQYKDDIRAERIDAEIATAPDEFSILQVIHTPTDATVRTRQVYFRRQFNEVKEFVWTLHNYDGVWIIEDFSVKNLGTQ